MTLSRFVKLTQSSDAGWLRNPNAKSRWDTTQEGGNEFSEVESAIVKQIGILEGSSLSNKSYDGAVILGSSIASMAKRFFHLQDMLKTVKLSNIYLMGSTENISQYLDSLREVIKLYPDKFVKNVALPESLTEHGLMNFYLNNLIWPDQLHNIKVICLPSEMKKIDNEKYVKPTTNDELNTLSNHLEKSNSKSKLAIISHSPFGFRQNLIFQALSVKHDVETTFAGHQSYSKLNSLSGMKLTPQVVLDELARLFYQLDKFIDNKQERLKNIGINVDKVSNETQLTKMRV